VAIVTAPEFRAALAALGLRQNRLAECLGVTTATVSRWAVGRIAVPQYAVFALELLTALNDPTMGVGAVTGDQ
jgi:DNA-binding transcriptional regulator YiaG